MPFTFSHPAIVLPLLYKHRKLFSATGLIVGSITPDFESFIWVRDTKIYSHTWAGIFWFDLPLALIIAMVFHVIVRDPLIENLPLPLQERFVRFKNFQWFAYFRKNFIIVIISLLIGIASHLLWDAFTHLNLRDPDATTSTVMIFGERLYKILQFICSFLGLVIIAWAIYKMPKTKVMTKNKLKYQYWLIIAFLSVLIGIIMVTGLYTIGLLDVILYIEIAISAFLAALVIVSFLYSLIIKGAL